MKKLFISTFLVIQVVFSYSQSITGVTGKIIDSKTLKPIESAIASIQNTNLSQITDVGGEFSITNVVSGKQLLLVKSNGYRDLLIQIENLKVSAAYNGDLLCHVNGGLEARLVKTIFY